MASRKRAKPTSADLDAQPVDNRQQPADREPWSGDPPHVDAARERLLDAAARCIARDGLAATSVASVATEAGVSRPTVYRYFEDRDDLVGQALHAAAERLRNMVTDRIEGMSSAADMIVEAVVVAVHEVPNDPVLRAIWNSATADATVVGAFTEAPAIAWVRQCLAPAVSLAGWSDRDTDEALELVLRMVLSLLVTPAPHRAPRDLRSFLRRRLVPALGL